MHDYFNHVCLNETQNFWHHQSQHVCTYCQLHLTCTTDMSASSVREHILSSTRCTAALRPYSTLTGSFLCHSVVLRSLLCKGFITVMLGEKILLYCHSGKTDIFTLHNINITMHPLCAFWVDLCDQSSNPASYWTFSDFMILGLKMTYIFTL